MADPREALHADGDRYHAQNHAGIGTIADPVFDELALIHRIRPIGSVLEIGCTTGFRLEKARAAFGARVAGIDASQAAIDEGRRAYPQVQLEHGIAPQDLSTWHGQTFDAIVAGHLLYLLPREDLFAFAAAVDALLKPDGHLIVMDFLNSTPHSADYAHHAALRVFKGDPSAPWLWSPTYTLVARRVYDLAADESAMTDPRAWQTVDVLRKHDATDAYPAMETLPSVHADRAQRMDRQGA